MQQRVIGYVLIAAGIVASALMFGTLEPWESGYFSRGGFMMGLSNSDTFGGIPLGIAFAVLVGVALVGLGLVLFAKREE